jgi:hypothetical protein
MLKSVNTLYNFNNYIKFPIILLFYFIIYSKPLKEAGAAGGLAIKSALSLLAVS